MTHDLTTRLIYGAISAIGNVNVHPDGAVLPAGVPVCKLAIESWHVGTLPWFSATSTLGLLGGGVQIGGSRRTTPSSTSDVQLILDKSFRDPEWDYDFTNFRDTTAFYRGGQRYYRPCGWKRYAIKVKGVYESDAWLGPPGARHESDVDEWPVSYHGTSFDNAKSIAAHRYLVSKVKRDKYGRGIYSTPDTNIAKLYASTFNHDGKTYQAMLQNRINMKKTRFISHENYFVTEDEDSIRMYGILIREVLVHEEYSSRDSCTFL
ncbi:unnamed protein product [Darwinula stevensoni]|uniref:PARP catalytic domain-containing protein n=1 Tax=Darwinula stevensoni TaxID=69355 RepID=A0A7R8XJ15_9CRUS|nr:unnamed protein product [Darwinula stevensoni]CAG0891794.1 unnamed protein product [Darwinula stevensoni]